MWSLVKGVGNAMPCNRTGYDRHNTRTPASQIHWKREKAKKREKRRKGKQLTTSYARTLRQAQQNQIHWKTKREKQPKREKIKGRTKRKEQKKETNRHVPWYLIILISIKQIMSLILRISTVNVRTISAQHYKYQWKYEWIDHNACPRVVRDTVWYIIRSMGKICIVFQPSSRAITCAAIVTSWLSALKSQRVTYFLLFYPPADG